MGRGPVARNEAVVFSANGLPEKMTRLPIEYCEQRWPIRPQDSIRSDMRGMAVPKPGNVVSVPGLSDRGVDVSDRKEGELVLRVDRGFGLFGSQLLILAGVKQQGPAVARFEVFHAPDI